MGEGDVHSEGAAPLQQHERGQCLQGAAVHDLAGSSLRADERGARGDSGGGCLRLGFRDARRSCLVIASGPSAIGTLRSTESWRTWPAITVNDSWRLNHYASALYAADGGWWEQRDRPTGLRYIDLARKFFRGQLWTCDPLAAREHGLNLIGIERKEGLSRTQGLIRMGGLVGNSGAQAINLATLAGARRLILIGFDMCKGEVDGKPDQVHWHGDHPRPLNNAPSFERFIEGMGKMAADLHADGIEVVNCSAKSALPYWPKRSLEDALS